MNIIDRHLDSNKNSLFLQLLRASQIQQSLLISTLVSSQQKAISSHLQQKQDQILPSSDAEKSETNCFQTNSIEQFNNQLQTLFNQSLIGSSIENKPINSLPTLQQPVSHSLLQKSKQEFEKRHSNKFKCPTTNRPRAQTNPNTFNLCRKMRPKTQSFNSVSIQRTAFRHHPINLPKRNSDARVLEEFAAMYLLKSLNPTTTKPESTIKPIETQNLSINVLHQILDDVLETSQL